MKRQIRPSYCAGCGIGPIFSHRPYCPVAQPGLVEVGATYRWADCSYIVVGYQSILLYYAGAWQPSVLFRRLTRDDSEAQRFACSIQEFSEKAKLVSSADSLGRLG